MNRYQVDYEIDMDDRVSHNISEETMIDAIVKIEKLYKGRILVITKIELKDRG